NTTGGSLSGSEAAAPTNAVVLSTEGKSDWAHWGLSTTSSFDHKAAVPQQISNFTAIGTNVLQRLANGVTLWAWSGGTPTATATNSTTGVFLTGFTNGFDLTLPADTNSRTLKIYPGVSAASGNF